MRTMGLSATILLLIGCSIGATRSGDAGRADAGTRPDSSANRDVGLISADSSSARSDAADSASGRALGEPVPLFAVAAGATIATKDFDGSASSSPNGPISDYEWDFGDGASSSGATPSHAYAASGCFDVTLRVTDNQGATAHVTRTVAVSTEEPSGAPTLVFTPPLPREGALVPRDRATNLGTVEVAGLLAGTGWTELIVTLRDSVGVPTEYRSSICEGAFSASAQIPARLERYSLQVEVAAGERSATVREVDDLVVGDVIVINGQSNAVAASYSGSANANQSPFLRSFGTRSGDPGAVSADDSWHRAEGDAGDTGVGAIGQWALVMGARLVAETRIPLAIINGALGGRPIDYFQRNDANHTDSSTNYGRLLDRVRRAGLTDSVRAIMYYQGENDGSDALAHRDGFMALHEDWQDDYPNVEQFYVAQVRSGCGSPSIELRDYQRRFAETLPRTTVMSTHNLNAHDGCHFGFVGGYRELGERYARLLGRDLFGVASVPDTEAVDVENAERRGNLIVIHTRGDASSLKVDAGAAADFALVGGTASVMSVSASGTDLQIMLNGDASGLSRVAYLGHSGGGSWITNANGVGLLAFTLAL